MTEKAKIILYAADDEIEHAQGIVEYDDKYFDAELVERKGRLYSYYNFYYEGDLLVLFFRETNVPVLVTEF